MDERDARYTLTVYVALPGTPLAGGGTSDAGHVYYGLSDGINSWSYGFGPVTHGTTMGPGAPISDDVSVYQNPRYARTIEITRQQYDKMHEFGRNPGQHGFDMGYNGATNSCIDFSWGALNHAGLHRRSPLGFGDKTFEGELKPQENIPMFKRIKAPFPDSDLNSENYNQKPDRTLMQFFLSENQESVPVGVTGQLAGGASRGYQSDPMFVQAEQAVKRMEAGLSRGYDHCSERLAASAACMAKEQGFSRVDHVVLGYDNGQVKNGGGGFVVQGELDDPAHLRAQGSIVAALQTPVEISQQLFEKIAQTVSQDNEHQQGYLQREEHSGPRMA